MKLLIVEDEARIAQSLRRGFDEESFTVELAFDGEEGLSKILKDEFDAIILDLMLPKISGLSVLKTMRERKNYTPVIILTAKNTTEDKIEGLDIGADDYLAKPFSFEELLARVRALIRRSTARENILKVDTLELNPRTQMVFRSSQPIHVSSREFKILEYMLANKGSILSESRIINHVWNYDADISSNVVAAHIKNLRSKIDKSFQIEKQLIKTIRGMGYKIDG
jgi:two-component system, OmpR family, response regulator